MRVALYFGSFNPVHLGHLKLAEYLTDNDLVDEVWFVISPCNPLKEQSELLDEYIRLDMLFFAIRSNPGFKACDIEFTMPIPSYSIDTLNVLSKQFPDYQFELIIGSDNALVFDQWKDYTEILTNYPVLVYPRKNYDFAQVAARYPQMNLLNTPIYDISSTQIRDSIAQKKDISQWLHPSVLQFIKENNLYQ
ncbi:nicotinate (nicotinamide) nucleotide adenylyltransferase [Paludibacter propionicigenes WB4]|uniref:Probable nicotinate-nucleotide adenylyltransferase n=1 Tax=Paludibacter propionicigenes (strain DSM 17365 / JCM 13257 / WB4) TaxID=694427 RepID=E4T296_PALPW|nr:nicotinate (nicotinamide) nucleotide adenylyltransferase [Paludibacter propionicigenes]ADQ78840.1 nicotinate (nicotinamide) nucleotide adenylyltransferase [Paludibacter propionicigenes WB4]